MTGVFGSISYDDFSQSLNSAIDWINTLGISYEKSRVGEYRRAIRTLLEIYESNDFTNAKKEFPRLVTAVYESNDLITIHKGFSGKYDREINEHLKKYLKGPADYRSEMTSSSSNLSRNIAFELLVSSKLVFAGLKLDFRIKTDIAAYFDNRSVLFECKRPQTIDTLESNIKKAFKQLERKYKNPECSRHRGIIAIDVSKLLNPDFKLYVQPNANAIDAGLTHILDKFIQQNDHLWQLSRNKKTIAILFRYALMAINQEKGEMLTYCQQYGLTPINNSGSRNIETAKHLAGVINGK